MRGVPARRREGSLDLRVFPPHSRARVAACASLRGPRVACVPTQAFLAWAFAGTSVHRTLALFRLTHGTVVFVRLTRGEPVRPGKVPRALFLPRPHLCRLGVGIPGQASGLRNNCSPCLHRRPFEKRLPNLTGFRSQAKIWETAMPWKDFFSILLDACGDRTVLSKVPRRRGRGRHP